MQPVLPVCSIVLPLRTLPGSPVQFTVSLNNERPFRMSAIYIDDTGVNPDQYPSRPSIMHQCNSPGEEAGVDIAVYTLPYSPQARAKISIPNPSLSLLVVR